MKRWLASCTATLILAGCASDPPPRPEPPPPQLYIEDQSAAAPPPPPTAPPAQAEAAPASSPAPLPSDAAPVAASAPVAAPPPPAVEPEAPPAATEWAHEYPTGRWVYANGYGWMWVPANAASTVDDGVPYAYMYTPRYGWTWYVSPWGPGPYRYGAWVRRPYYPRGYRGGWVAGPHVTIRLGGPTHYRHYRAPHRGRRW